MERFMMFKVSSNMFEAEKPFLRCSFALYLLRVFIIDSYFQNYCVRQTCHENRLIDE